MSLALPVTLSLLALGGVYALDRSSKAAPAAPPAPGPLPPMPMPVPVTPTSPPSPEVMALLTLIQSGPNSPEVSTAIQTMVAQQRAGNIHLDAGQLNLISSTLKANGYVNEAAQVDMLVMAMPATMGVLHSRSRGRRYW